MLSCGCFVSSSSALVHCAENESIQEWRAHFDQKQKARAWLIPGRILWLFHPWLIHQTCVTKKNIVFNHSHNPTSVPKWDLSPNRRVPVASQSVDGAVAFRRRPWLCGSSSSFKRWLKFKPVDWMLPSSCFLPLGTLIFADRRSQVGQFIP